MTTDEIQTASETLVKSRYADGPASIIQFRDEMRQSEPAASDLLQVLERAAEIAQAQPLDLGDLNEMDAKHPGWDVPSMADCPQHPRSRRQRRKRLKLLISRNARKHARMASTHGASNLNVEGMAAVVEALREELAAI